MYITGKKHLDEIILGLSIDTLNDIILYKESIDYNTDRSITEEEEMKLFYRNQILEKGVLQRPAIVG